MHAFVEDLHWLSVTVSQTPLTQSPLTTHALPATPQPGAFATRPPIATPSLHIETLQVPIAQMPLWQSVSSAQFLLTAHLVLQSGPPQSTSVSPGPPSPESNLLFSHR